MTDEIRPKIIIDKRELRSPVHRELDRLNADIELMVLETGDYVVSDRCCIERKDINDFFYSWFTDRKLFSQIIDMSSAYSRPILLIEGGDPFYSNRRVHPKAIQGVMNALALMRVPVLYSLNAKETAGVIYALAKKEQSDKKGIPAMHGSRSHRTPDEQLVYSITSLPDMGSVTAINLLKRFGSIQRIVNAGSDELQECDNVGKKTAENVYGFFRRGYGI